MPGPLTVSFGDVSISRGIDFTFGPGVQPSVCMIYTVPHSLRMTDIAPLVFGLVDGPTFTFPDCKLEAPQLDTGQSGAVWRLPILDRRWKWQFAHIFGSYNIRKPNGTYLREKTPQELASLLLDSMGESGYNVSQLPNDARPERYWETGADSASELDRLCSELGCIVVLNWQTNRVEIWPLGAGSILPDGAIEGRSFAPVKRSSPSSIRVEAGNTLFQDTFTTEAVGLDVDDKWKPIDQLSYRPSGGWGNTFPPGGFPHLLDTDTYTLHGRTLKTRDLAESTVFRCYRVNGLLSGGWVPTYLTTADLSIQPQSRKDLQLSDELADEEINPSDGGLRRLPAVVYARYLAESRMGRVASSVPVRYPHTFGFDSEHGIVQFGEPLYLRSGGDVVPAEVQYECAFHAGRDGVMHRLSKTNATGSPATTPDRLISRPEILFRSIQRYAANAPFAEEDNLADAEQRLQYWFDAAIGEYNLQIGGTLRYSGLVPILVDGRTLQVTWSAGGLRAARTIASQAQRHNRIVRPLDEYRDRLKAKQADQELRKLRSLDASPAQLRWAGGLV